jgi:hypothetical protein
MKKHLKIILPIFLALLALLLLFYWYELRPLTIRQNCSQKVADGILNKDYEKAERRSEFDWWYQTCLKKHGLKE